jgi:hypothetical protein
MGSRGRKTNLLVSVTLVFLADGLDAGSTGSSDGSGIPKVTSSQE